MSYIQHPDFKIHYTAHGSGSTPIILLHGNFGSQRHWQLFCQSLDESLTAIAPDLRGCGDSEAPKDGYGIQTLSQDLLFLVEQLNIEKFHLVGHSLGGAIAQEFSGTHPERILSLTLVSPAPAEGLEMASKDSFISKYFSPETIFYYLDKFNLKKSALHSTFKKTMPGLKDQPELLDMVIEDAIKMDGRALQGFWHTLQSWTGLQHLKKFNFPVLIVHGGLDSVIKAEPLERMVKQISNCRFSKWKGVGHAPQMEKPDAFNHLLKGFILGAIEPEETTELPETEQPSKLTAIKHWFKKIISKCKSS